MASQLMPALYDTVPTERRDLEPGDACCELIQHRPLARQAFVVRPSNLQDHAGSVRRRQRD